MAVSGCPMRKGRSKRTKLAYTNSSTMTGIALLLPLRRALPGPWHNYGFDHARGEYIIAMDGDLQHDPADIPVFLEKIAAGYDIVSGWRKVRVDNFWMRRIPSRMANWLMAKLSGVDIHDFGTTFKAYRREILEQV